MKVTLEQVAERAGVSRGAASLVLRDHPKAKTFQDATIQRVRAAAEALGYQPNYFQMRRNRSQVLMCYVPSLQDLYAAGVAEAFQQRAAERTYWVTVHAGGTACGAELFDRRIIGTHGIGAVALIGGIARQVDGPTLEALVDRGVRVVQIGRDRATRGVSRVLTDNRQGGRMIAEHLLQRGMKRVVLFSESGVDPQRRAREAGFREVLETARDVRLEAISMPGTTGTPGAIEGSGYQAARDRLSAGKRGADVDVFVTQADLRAFGVYRAIHEAGLQPGRDIAVVGYTDIWPSSMIYPGLTTVHEPTGEMGRAAADVLIEQLEDESEAPTPRCVVLTPTLEPRGSTEMWRPREGVSRH